MSISTSARQALRIGAALFMAVGVVVMTGAAPAEAKSYSDSELGAWDGPIYIAKAKSKRSASAKYRASAKRKGYAIKSGSKGKKYAALGKPVYDAPQRKSLTGGGVRWVANSGCLSGQLRSVIHSVAANYGSVTVSSTCRSRGHNARVGGAKKSHHLTGSAADFRVHGNWGAAYAYLRSSGSVGGLKHYGGGLFHIDTGARRAF